MSGEIQVNMVKIHKAPTESIDGVNKEYVDSKLDKVNTTVKPATEEDTPQIILSDNSESVHSVRSVMQFCHPDISGHILWRFALSHIDPGLGKFDRFQIQYNSAPFDSSAVWNHVADFPYIGNHHCT